MLNKIALAFVMLFALAMTGCSSFQNVTPERAIAIALAGNKVIAQCYADYQAELDALTATAVLAENGLAPVPPAPVTELSPSGTYVVNEHSADE